MIIDIDQSSGFCWGVVKTIESVEKELKKRENEDIYVLGNIIHNPREIERLENKGLKTIAHKDLNVLQDTNAKVIIRAHGEPPTTYEKLNKLGVNLTDATCPLVKNLQQRVLKYYKDGWRIVIFGKKEHAEVIGLRGVCNDECIVVRDVDEAVTNVDCDRRTVLISQTTMDKPSFFKIKTAIREKFEKHYNENVDEFFIAKDTICKFVSDREEQLRKFASEHEVVLFVAGRDSSNGKSLFNVCSNVNDRTIFIESYEEIDYNMLKEVKSIGITGATSTPQWYMERVKEILLQKVNS